MTKQLDYKENVNLSFVLDTDAPVKNIKGYLNGKELFILSELTTTRTGELTIYGSKFIDYNTLNIEYEDENGEKYTVNESFNTKVINIPWYARILRIFSNLF